MSELAVASRAAVIRRIFVWDLPVRLFHWALVALMVVLYVTAEVMDDAIETHALAGYGVLTLVLFRLAWGFVGGAHARFGDFLRGPGAGWRYLRALLGPGESFVAGHNPLGGWMVVALLLALLGQAALGLFSNDDILFDGPLRHLVSKETSDLLTGLHEQLFAVLLSLVCIHVAAVAFHKIVKGENLTPAMFTGYKEVPEGVELKEGRRASGLLAAVVFAACAALVYLLVA